MHPIYHPTTIVVVDPTTPFVSGFLRRYEERFLVTSTATAQEAIELINTRKNAGWRPAMFFAPYVGETSGGFAESNRLFELRYSMIADIVESRGRFEMVSVVIACLSMPDMTGIEFFDRVRGSSAKKLLLTESAQQSQAVAPLNESLIDVFLLKQTSGGGERLAAEIERLQVEFFDDLLSPLQAAASAGDMAFVNDWAVDARFRRIAEDHGAVEYYVLTPPPRILLMDASGNRTSIMVYDEDTMRAQVEIAQAMDAPEALLKRLRQRNAIAFFPTASGFYEPRLSASWAKYIHLAERVTGARTWWMAIVRHELGATDRNTVPLADYRRHGSDLSAPP